MSQVARNLKLAIGRVIGTAKRKQPDIVDEWKALCNANGVNPSDRAIGLFAWDLEQNGADIASIRKEPGSSEEEKVAAAVGMAQQMMSLSSSFTDSWIKRETAHKADMEMLLSEIRNIKLQETLGARPGEG